MYSSPFTFLLPFPRSPLRSYDWVCPFPRRCWRALRSPASASFCLAQEAFRTSRFVRKAMLLPLGVKILWFALSLTGLAGCWVVSIALGRTIGSPWAPIVYCVGCSVLEGIFCIGMVWKMDPYSMPGRFCIAQSVLIALGTFIVTGVVCTLSYMTNQIVLRPKTWANSKHLAFAWVPIYTLPIVVFPVAALVTHVALVVKLRAVQPATEFYCDSSSPQWVRFLSYAGTPLLLSIPSLYLSIKTVLRVNAINRHIQRARTSEIDMDPPNSSDESCSSPSDVYTKAPRSKKFSLKRTFSARRKVSKSRAVEKDSFDSDIDTQLKSQTDTSSLTPSLRFTVAPTPRSSKGREGGSGAGVVDLTSGPAIGGGAMGGKTAAAVHFNLPIRPPPSSRDIVLRAGCVSPSSVLSSDSEAASASSSPALNAAPSPVTAAIYSARENPDSNATIAEVHREPSTLDLKAPYALACEKQDRMGAGFASTRDKDESWRSVMELTSGQEEIKSQRIIAWHVNHHGSGYPDAKGTEDCTEEEVEDDEGEIKGEDDDTLSEELTDRSLPKIRTHTKHFTNYILPGEPMRSKRPPPPYLSSTIWRIILFQITFVFVQILGSLSTLIDVARQSNPTPLGTHHFAMLFVAWGPVFFFGSLSHVRQNMPLKRNSAKS